MQNIIKEAPEVIDGFRELTGAIDRYSPLDLKTKELILLGMFTADKSIRGIDTHVKICLDAGGTREEILAAILYATPIVGIPSVTIAFEKAIEVINNYKRE